MSANYANADSLVSIGWVLEHLNDPKVKLIEVDVDTTSYDKGHIKGAIGWNWQTQLQDRVTRNVVDPRTFAELCRRAGINNDDTVILYGDNNNWFAAWALWQFKYHGHKDVRLMNGGRKKWELEKRELTTEVPRVMQSNYAIPPTDESIRAYRREIEDVLHTGRVNLVDVRSPDEYSGKIIAPPGITPARKASHGRRRPMRMERLRVPMSSRSSTRMPAWIFPSPPLPIAASASAAAIPGLCSSICWA